MKKGLISLTALIIILNPGSLAESNGTANPPSHELTWQDLFKQSIQHWIEELSSQDPAFHSWNSASFQYESLGANSKQWLVTIYKENNTLGYLIVAENPPTENAEDNISFTLMEYGLGQPLFSQKPDWALAVYGGLESYWQTDEDIYDAVTGEQYPLSASELELRDLPASGIDEKAKLSDWFFLDDSAEPFDDIYWLDKKEMEMHQSGEIINQIKQKQAITLVTHLYQQRVLAPFSVTGYHMWEREEERNLFISLEDQGYRFLPFSYCQTQGSFIIKK